MLIKHGAGTANVIPQIPAEADEILRLIDAHAKQIVYLDDAMRFVLGKIQLAIEYGICRRAAHEIVTWRRENENILLKGWRSLRGRESLNATEVNETVSELARRFIYGTPEYLTIIDHLRAWGPVRKWSINTVQPFKTLRFMSVDGINVLLYETLTSLERSHKICGEPMTLDSWFKPLHQFITDILETNFIGGALKVIGSGESVSMELPADAQDALLRTFQYDLQVTTRQLIQEALEQYECAYVLEH